MRSPPWSPSPSAAAPTARRRSRGSRPTGRRRSPACPRPGPAAAAPPGSPARRRRNAGWSPGPAGSSTTATGRQLPEDTDPAFQGTIEFRPNEAAEQFIPDKPPVDDSQLFAPPELEQNPIAEPPRSKVRQLPPLLRKVRSQLQGPAPHRLLHRHPQGEGRAARQAWREHRRPHPAADLRHRSPQAGPEAEPGELPDPARLPGLRGEAQVTTRSAWRPPAAPPPRGAAQPPQPGALQRHPRRPALRRRARQRRPGATGHRAAAAARRRRPGDGR